LGASFGIGQNLIQPRHDPLCVFVSSLFNCASKEHYGGKTFTIEARHASRANSHIQSATPNGQPLDRWWICQKDVLRGGHLVLELGPIPNAKWTKGCPLPD